MSNHSAANAGAAGRMVLRFAGRALAALGLWCGGAMLAHAQPTPAQILGYKPKCDGVSVTEPAPADIAGCKLDIVKTPGGGSGFVLTDKGGQTLRRFLDTSGAGRVDQYSFYKDGAEVYREILTKNGVEVRWIGAGGMKWGVGQAVTQTKIKITGWRMISAEEAAYEAFQALATGDTERLQAVLLSEQEIGSLGLPAAEAQKLAARVKGATAKLAQVRTKLSDIATAKFGHLENGQPGAYPIDVTGGANELIKIVNGLILFENPTSATKKNDFINAPEMIQIGNAWRLTDVPSTESVEPGSDDYRKALDAIAKHEPTNPGGIKGAKAVEWNMARIKLATEAAKYAPTANERDSWNRQIIDMLASTTSGGDADSASLLSKWKQHFATTQPGGGLAAYGAYREIWALYQATVSDPKIASNSRLFGEAQDKYHKELRKFVTDFAKADDAPDALIQLAMGAEFTSKDDEAKKYYQQIVLDFPAHANRPKAEGAIRRLDSVGKTLELTCPTLAGQPFSMAAVTGKVTVVYYWSTLSSQAGGDFTSLKKLQADYAKELAIVCVNLDDEPTNAKTFVGQNGGFTTHHLHQAGGMNGPLATQYGIFGLPQLFLVGTDGKVVSNKIQIGMLDDEISKLVKK